MPHWRLQGVVFVACLLWEVRNGCAEFYTRKQLKFLSPACLNCSLWHRLFTILKGNNCLYLLRNISAWKSHLHSCSEPAKLLHLRFSVDFCLVPRWGRLHKKGQTQPYTGTQQNWLAEFKPRDTHSLLRFSRPVKAPLVFSIVPEMSLWSSSLGRGQKRARNQRLSPSVTVTNKWRKLESATWELPIFSWQVPESAESCSKAALITSPALTHGGMVQSRKSPGLFLAETLWDSYFLPSRFLSFSSSVHPNRRRKIKINCQN